MAKKSKRVLSVLLTLIMILGLLPTSVFAYGQDQVVSNGLEETSPEGQVKYSKMIEQTGENAFNITLTVKTKEEIKEQTVSQDAAVVLVLDVSNSMKNEVNGSSKISQAKQAAKEFVEAFTTEAGSGRRMGSIVEFGANAKTVSGWTNANGAIDAVEASIDKVQIGFVYDYDFFGDPISDLGGTNIEAGLRLANNLLGQVSDIGNKYVVLLSDGVPTYHVANWDESSSTTFMAGTYGGGTKATHEDYHDIYCTKRWWDHQQHGDNIPKQIKDQGAKLYTVAYDLRGNNNGYVNDQNATQWLANFSTKMIDAGDDIFEGLEQIAEIIVNQAKAWILTDPMSTFVEVDTSALPSDVAVGTTAELENSDAVRKYYTDTKTLVWDLKGETERSKETVDGVTWYTYTFTYPIELNTAAEGFKENNPYPTNDPTSLSYMITKDGELDPTLYNVPLTVPTVKGEIPEVPYTIEYYVKDKETGEYPETPTDSTSDTAKMWTTVSAPSNYATKYGENYRFVEGATSIKLTSTESNVLKLYYEPIPANVIVYHYVSTVNHTDDGDVYSVPELRDHREYGNQYKGDEFTVPEEDFLDKETYTLVDSLMDENGDTYTTGTYTDVTLPEGTTTINIYYTTEGEDQRSPVNYEIHYWYREDSWQLNADGKYEVVTDIYEEDTTKLIKSWNYHGETIPAPDESGADYTLDEDMTEATSMTLDKDAAENRLDIYYYKDAPATPGVGTATLTIKHVYKQQTISGVEEVKADNWTECENQIVNVGETWYANPDPKEDYKLVTASDKRQVTITEADTHYEIVVEYYKDVRDPVDIVINHYYTTYTWTVDPETGDGEYVKTGSEELLGVHATGIHYAGEEFEPPQVANGYEYVFGGDKAILTAGTNIFNLYYETKIGGEANEADVTINHIYTTYRSYVDADGNVVLNEPSSTTESESTHYGVKGDTITAVPNDKEDEFTFVKADTDDLVVTLKGKDGQYNLYYEKYENTLGETYPVTVQPIYKTYTTRVNDEGKVVTELTNTENGTQVKLGDFYVGQKVTALAADYGKDGFTYDASDKQTTKDLTVQVTGAAENDVITVVYKRVVDELGLPIVVLVNNVYTTVTEYIDADGNLQTSESSFTSSNTAYKCYLGQDFDTTGKGTQMPGYVVDTREGITQPAASVKVTQDGQMVTFYWLQEVDHTVPATVKVVHHYTLKDSNPNVGTSSWVVGADDEPLTGYFAGQYYLPGYNFQGGSFSAENVTEVVPSGATTDPGVKLVAGLNEIHIYYEKSVDSRVSTTVKVIHNYYKDADALAAGTTEASYEENIPAMEADKFTATLRLENGSLYYEFVSANPENYTVVVDDDAANNVITISYVRADATYTVVHEYYSSGRFMGSTQSTETGKPGSTVSADDIGKITSFEGRNYSYLSADPETMVLAADGENVMTLRYTRSSGGGGGGGGGGGSTDPDTDPDPGTDIEDPDVPTTDLPDVPTGEPTEPVEEPTEIEEPEVPMAEAPETGDSNFAYLHLLSLASALGLVALFLSDKRSKKHRDEA